MRDEPDSLTEFATYGARVIAMSMNGEWVRVLRALKDFEEC